MTDNLHGYHLISKYYYPTKNKVIQYLLQTQQITYGFEKIALSSHAV